MVDRIRKMDTARSSPVSDTHHAIVAPYEPLSFIGSSEVQPARTQTCWSSAPCFASKNAPVTSPDCRKMALARVNTLKTEFQGWEEGEKEEEEEKEYPVRRTTLLWFLRR